MRYDLAANRKNVDAQITVAEPPSPCWRGGDIIEGDNLPSVVTRTKTPRLTIKRSGSDCLPLNKQHRDHAEMVKRLHDSGRAQHATK